MIASRSEIQKNGAGASLGDLARAAPGLWYDRPVRTQILVAFAAITVVISLFAGFLEVLDARNRVSIEMSAPVELAESFVQETAKNLTSESLVPSLLDTLALRLRSLRHVRVEVVEPTGETHHISTSSDTDQLAGARVPAWFIALIHPESIHREVAIMAGTRRAATVRIHGEPADEIAEVWNDFKTMALLWLGGNLLMLGALYVVLGRILDPLAALGEAIQGLEHGDFAVRMQPPKVRELRLIANRFNHLAGALDTAHAEITRLCRDLMTVQEEERRQIASELHDEFGPCLFGIMVNAASIEKHAREIAPGKTEAISDRVEEIKAISDRLKRLNRSLLEKLRPVALGRITVEELVRELVREMERRHADTRFSILAHDLARSYGEDVDLTIYRCIQESITNALRHGKAASIVIELRHDLGSTGQRKRTSHKITLRIRDDGAGLAPSAAVGFGLASMRERARAHGGSFSIGGNWPSGTTVTITIPVDLSDAGVRRIADLIET